MKTTKTKSQLPSAEQSTGLEAAQFHDGMVVKAEDLEAAAQYPVSLLQSVLRSYFGCGVVCGLELGLRKPLDGEASWVVTVGGGLAMDCQGFPIELICPVQLDFTPDPCMYEPLPDRVYIAIRRISSDEATSEPCGCTHSHEEGNKECNRLRDRALVKAFTRAQLDELTGGVCQRQHKGNHKDKGHHGCADEDGEGNSSDATDWCAELKNCGCCSCDGEWVLLGTVKIDKDEGVSHPATKGRRWVKPVKALCGLEGLIQRIEELEDRVKELSSGNQDDSQPSRSL
jgi:hypothetical protein